LYGEARGEMNSDFKERERESSATSPSFSLIADLELEIEGSNGHVREV